MDSLKFGTSGLRGLVTDLTPAACQLYARAFIGHEHAAGRLIQGAPVLVGYDLRASSPMIASAIVAAVRDAGHEPVNCGALPTPALALASLERRIPAIMVTGSHIPDDRNGLKFYRRDGEIDKTDEAGILKQLPLFKGRALAPAGLGAAPVMPQVLAGYIDRYKSLAAGLSLAGLRIGVYQHSSVARDVLVEILTALGADTIALARSDAFIPVDTEALRPEDIALAKAWAADPGFDALVSTDGDADRPLVADETGTFLRGDILGLLTAKFLGANTVVTPVTSTSAIEESALVATVIRTRVGSPYVLAGMAEASGVVVGFEANGGVLLGSDAAMAGVPLPALPTRDAVLPILAVLALAQQRALSLSALVATLPQRRTASDRIKDSPTEDNIAFLNRLAHEPGLIEAFFAPQGDIAKVNLTDGVQVTLSAGETIHYRASGNAPELRCYTEAITQERAGALLAWGLGAARLAL